jgi:hypothetical protein
MEKIVLGSIRIEDTVFHNGPRLLVSAEIADEAIRRELLDAMQHASDEVLLQLVEQCGLALTDPVRWLANPYRRQNNQLMWVLQFLQRAISVRPELKLPEVAPGSGLLQTRFVSIFNGRRLTLPAVEEIFFSGLAAPR